MWKSIFYFDQVILQVRDLKLLVRVKVPSGQNFESESKRQYLVESFNSL